MQATLLSKAKTIGITFLKSIIIFFSNHRTNSKKRLLKMIQENRHNAPIIPKNINIRDLIDSAQYPEK